MIVWLEKPLIIAIHERQIAEHGGTQGVRDVTLLESALSRAQQLHAYGDPAPDLVDLAAVLSHGLARNHPFLDGNKRTAAVACETFLNVNGIDLIAADVDLYPQFLSQAEGGLAVEEFAEWLRVRTVSRTGRVQESAAKYPARARSARTRLPAKA